MTTMIDRAIRAVEEQGSDGCCSIDEEHAARIARAVLMAVREPDNELQIEAWLWAPDEDYSDAQRLSDFTAMIDKILSETP